MYTVRLHTSLGSFEKKYTVDLSNVGKGSVKEQVIPIQKGLDLAHEMIKNFDTSPLIANGPRRVLTVRSLEIYADFSSNFLFTWEKTNSNGKLPKTFKGHWHY